MPRYQAATKGFIAPHIIVEGRQFSYDGPYGTWMIPLDAEAEAKADEFYQAHPNAGINPVEQLRVRGGEPGEFEPPAVFLDAEPAAAKELDLSANTLATPGKAKPGLSEGGKAEAVK
jgi:hypothetical protein